MQNIEPKAAQTIHVAVGVIESCDSKILIAKRPIDKHQGGLWEFPGGKLNDDEDTYSALKRELKEELDILIESACPLIQIRHQYSDRTVLLDVMKVLRWSGVPKSMEGQMIQWVDRAQLSNYEFPEANHPIIKAVKLPVYYCITPACVEYSNDFLQRLEHILATYDCWVQFRTFQNFDMGIERLYQRCLLLTQQYSALLILNSSLKDKIQTQDNLHLSSEHLMGLQSTELIRTGIIGASCHDVEELKQAEKLDLDYVLLGSVKTTSSHPHQKSLGWHRFQDLANQSRLPVYALGGLDFNDLDQALINDAQGIAMISGFWQK